MPVGRTKDVGWQVGVSITVPQPVDEVWPRLVAGNAVKAWLGSGVRLNGRTGQRYRTANGIVGEVRSFKPRDRVRLTWKPDNWDHETTVQVAVRDKGDRTVVQFHQERLASAAEREQQRQHWKTAAEDLRTALE